MIHIHTCVWQNKLFTLDLNCHAQDILFEEHFMIVL